MWIRQIAAAIALACTASACGGITDPSTNQTQTFSGTFDVGGAGPAHPFAASKNGEFFVTLTSLTPDTTAIVAVTLGQGSGANCLAVTNTVTTVGRQAFSGPLNKGNYCIQVGDSGLVVLSGPQSYSIRVSFP